MRLLLYAFAIAAAALLFGVAGAVQDPVVVRYTVPIAGLTHALRIAQVSDSHASRWDMPNVRLQRVMAQVNALKPDAIVLTGDYISGNPEDWTTAETRAAVAPFAALRAPLGVFAVLGNHDGPSQTAAALAGGVVLLRGTSADLGPVRLIGADDLLRGSPAVEAMRRVARLLPRDKPIIIVAHEPDFFQYMPTEAAMMIAGHTHGGQIRLPLVGGMRISPFLDAHLRGVFHENGQWLLVSSGLGTSILPMRVGVRPEIVEITLVPA